MYDPDTLVYEEPAGRKIIHVKGPESRLKNIAALAMKTGTFVKSMVYRAELRNLEMQLPRIFC